VLGVYGQENKVLCEQSCQPENDQQVGHEELGA
jgi:hypothetical protein